MAERKSDKIPTAKEAARATGSWNIGSAPPAMVTQRVDPGDRLVAELGDTRFEVAIPFQPLVMRAQIGRVVVAEKLRLVGLWALAEEQLLVATYFASFRYAFVARESRRVFLTEVAA
jgi:hypothetical protein